MAEILRHSNTCQVKMAKSSKLKSYIQLAQQAQPQPQTTKDKKSKRKKGKSESTKDASQKQ